MKDNDTNKSNERIFFLNPKAFFLVFLSKILFDKCNSCKNLDIVSNELHTDFIDSARAVQGVFDKCLKRKVFSI